MRNTAGSGQLVVSDLKDQAGNLFSVSPNTTSGDHFDDGPLVAVNTAHPDLMLLFGCAETGRAYCFGQLINAPAK